MPGLPQNAAEGVATNFGGALSFSLCAELAAWKVEEGSNLAWEKAEGNNIAKRQRWESRIFITSNKASEQIQSCPQLEHAPF